MMRARYVLLIAALVCILWVANPVRRARGGAVPCADVMHLVNHEITALSTERPDLSEIAKTLGSTPAWVEHCMLVYGRRPTRPGMESSEGREAKFEKFEEDEPEEPEEQASEEAGEEEKGPRVERPRVLHKADPTPTPYGEPRMF